MNWVVENWNTIWSLTLAHAALSFPPILLGLLIAIPLGAIAFRFRWSRGTILTVSGLLYAIPSLPLFVVLPTLIGTLILDPANVIIALTLYAVALLVRTVHDGLQSVSPQVLDAASAVGYSRMQRFFRVELPLAGPLIVAGLRVVSASTISLVSVGSLIGVASLGNFFLSGYNRQFATEILVGIVMTVVIAVVFDRLIVIVGRLLLPWNRGTTKRRRTRRDDDTDTQPDARSVAAPASPQKEVVA
ncbi:ABC transporter permease [Humidisolicoccus flavus]|uniref:ABC transporter permease n=1 Tax=Humidisolicoccus flavus TaxID=3111414 RepID=UPI00324592EA